MTEVKNMGIVLKKSERQRLSDICREYGFSLRDMITVYIRYGIKHTSEIIKDAYKT